MPRLGRCDIGVGEPSASARSNQGRVGRHPWPLTGTGAAGCPRRSGTPQAPDVRTHQFRVAAAQGRRRRSSRAQLLAGQLVQQPVAVDDVGRHRVARILKIESGHVAAVVGPDTPVLRPRSVTITSQPRSRKKPCWAPTPASSSTVRPAILELERGEVLLPALVVPLILRRRNLFGRRDPANPTQRHAGWSRIGHRGDSNRPSQRAPSGPPRSPRDPASNAARSPRHCAAIADTVPLADILPAPSDSQPAARAGCRRTAGRLRDVCGKRVNIERHRREGARRDV